MIGSEITAEALRRGHQLTAVTRSGTEIEGAASRAAELADLETFRALAADHDVVVVSVSPDRTGKPHEPLVEAHRAIIANGAQSRVFVVGGAGALEVDGVQLKDMPDFPAEYKAESTTFAQVLESYRGAEGLDWTMLAPAPVIAPGQRTGEYKLGQDSPVGDSISTQDFAVAVLDELESPKHRNQRFAVAN